MAKTSSAIAQPKQAKQAKPAKLATKNPTPRSKPSTSKATPPPLTPDPEPTTPIPPSKPSTIQPETIAEPTLETANADAAPPDFTEKLEQDFFEQVEADVFNAPPPDDAAQTEAEFLQWWDDLHQGAIDFAAGQSGEGLRTSAGRALYRRGIDLYRNKKFGGFLVKRSTSKGGDWLVVLAYLATVARSVSVAMQEMQNAPPPGQPVDGATHPSAAPGGVVIPDFDMKGEG